MASAPAGQSPPRKVDREDRTGKDGRAKKGGRGGGYTWDGNGCEEPVPVDKGDPNYVDEAEEEAAQPAARAEPDASAGADTVKEALGNKPPAVLDPSDGGGNAAAFPPLAGPQAPKAAT